MIVRIVTIVNRTIAGSHECKEANNTRKLNRQSFEQHIDLIRRGELACPSNRLHQDNFLELQEGLFVESTGGTMILNAMLSYTIVIGWLIHVHGEINSRTPTTQYIETMRVLRYMSFFSDK